MHAGARRLPAERARHAKRLGHIQVGPGAVTSVAIASSQTPSSTSTKQSSSSVLSSSSSTQSSSSTSSSATTSSSASVATSTSIQPSAIAAPSSFVTTPLVTLTSMSTSPISSTSTPQTNATAGTSSALSGGAIAGIIAGSVIVGAALLVFLIRKTYLRRRERKRISWNGAPGPSDPSPFPDVSERRTSFTSAANSPQRSAPPSASEAYGQSMYSTPVPPIVRMQPPTIPTYTVPTPPPATYNNPFQLAAYPTQAVLSTHTPGNPSALATTPVSSVRAPVEAIVKCTFVPTLPDELSIAVGERIVIVEQYDDGWNLCANGRGERGMVPRECLERVPSDQPDVGWGNVKRMTSLNPDRRRF